MVGRRVARIRTRESIKLHRGMAQDLSDSPQQAMYRGEQGVIIVETYMGKQHTIEVPLSNLKDILYP